MSSFNINGPSNNHPMVQSSQNLGKDGGGGGSTGYMNMRKKKKNSENSKEDDNSVFLEEEIEDTFEKQGDNKQKKERKFIGAISSFIKDRKQQNSKDNDYFSKTKEEETAEETGELGTFQKYNIQINKPSDILEDDEYEIVEDDDYYDGIDV